jgi:hypothetical protein
MEVAPALYVAFRCRTSPQQKKDVRFKHLGGAISLENVMQNKTKIQYYTRDNKMGSN